MAYASKFGRAIANPNAPSAFGVCDRCGLGYNLRSLVWQFEWCGVKLQNLKKRVCTVTCLDFPQPQLKSKVLPPDPVPVQDSRPEWFAQEENSTAYFIEVNGQIVQMNGPPNGPAPGPPEPPPALDPDPILEVPE